MWFNHRGRLSIFVGFCIFAVGFLQVDSMHAVREVNGSAHSAKVAVDTLKLADIMKSSVGFAVKPSHGTEKLVANKIKRQAPKPDKVDCKLVNPDKFEEIFWEGKCDPTDLSGAECKFNSSVNLNNGQCQCNPTYSYLIKEKKCVCLDGTSEKMPSATFVGSSQVSSICKSSHDKPCNGSVACSTGFCSAGKCACPEGLNFEKNKCVKTTPAPTTTPANGNGGNGPNGNGNTNSTTESLGFWEKNSEMVLVGSIISIVISLIPLSLAIFHILGHRNPAANSKVQKPLKKKGGNAKAPSKKRHGSAKAPSKKPRGSAKAPSKKHRESPESTSSSSE